MRQLRFVRPGADQDHVILETADDGERYLLPINSALRDAIRSDLPRLHAEEPEAANAGIGPREIQMRVRAGESAEDLAVEHEMSFEKVMRFAGPVLAERARIADEARRGRARRSTDDAQLVIFGEAVDSRFSAHGIDTAKVAWDAKRREDGNWVITARWVGGHAERTAEWLFQLAARAISPLDDTASDLLSDRPIRAVIADLPDRAPASVAAPAAGAASVSPLTRGVVAFPAMPDAHTGPLPSLDHVFDQEAPNPDAPRVSQLRAGSASTTVVTAPTAVTAGAARGSEARTEPRPEFDAPPLPLTLPAEAQRRVAAMARTPHREESEEQRAARARIPTWDDIMLGVRRKSD